LSTIHIEEAKFFLLFSSACIKPPVKPCLVKNERADVDGSGGARGTTFVAYARGIAGPVFIAMNRANWNSVALTSLISLL
jgi:hypothetical protein